MTNELTIDPEFAALIPPLSADELAGLESDIISHGCRVPLDVWDGVLIDGHTRYSICQKYSIAFETKAIEFTDRGAAIVWICTNQLARRNLVPFARVQLALRMEDVYKAQAKDRYTKTVGRPNKSVQNSAPIIDDPATPKKPEPKTRDQVAKDAGVSHDTVDKVKVILGKAAPEVKEAVKKGNMSINEAYNKTEKKHNHRAQGTGENEWYTPAKYIEISRGVMGEITLDPATTLPANKVVKAEVIFTENDSSLSQEWHGTVWLNPPYSQPKIQQFIEKLVAEYQKGNTKQAIVLTHNYTDTAWFQHAAKHCQAICFTRGRIAFISPGGEKAAPTQGQAFFYFGNNVDKFNEVFCSIGFVMVQL